MSDFRKEQRYFVAKLTDVKHAIEIGMLTDTDAAHFDRMLRCIRDARTDRGKPELDCVVIESDWRCYQTAWDLVEAEHIVNQAQLVDPVCDRCGDNCCGCYAEEAEAHEAQQETR